MEKQSAAGAHTLTDIGHEMEPQDNEKIKASDDKSDDAPVYGQIADTDTSI